MLGALGVLWRFSRPHTLLGTFISATGLYLIAVAELPGSGLDQLFWVMVAGAGVNVAIVGVNQLTDVEIDRVNKPHLPLAAGELSRDAAWRIVALAAAVPLVLALTQGALETAAVVGALAVGAAYSLPPVRLKRFPVVAARVHLGRARGRGQPRHVRPLQPRLRRHARRSRTRCGR